MHRTRFAAIAVGVLVVLSAVGGVTTGAQSGAETQVAVESAPTDWDEPEATHSVVFTVGTDATSAGEVFENVVIDYRPGQEPADVGNVGPEAIEWIGIDREGDDVGTRVDERAAITEVDDTGDGQALRIVTNGELQLSAGDQVVAVYRQVQNPQDQGSTLESNVQVTLNEDAGNDVATDATTYEWNEANVSLGDQTTTGDSITVDSVTVSEPGFVVVTNESGRNPDEIRGAAFVEPGTTADVQVPLDPPVTAETDLSAQVHLDTNGDRRFEYDGGIVDRPFENQDGNLLATDSATVTESESTSTVTESGSTSTVTESESTSTQEATAAETATESTETATRGDDGSTDDSSADEPSDSTATSTATAEGTDGDDANGTNSPSPTDGDGTGFGVIAAIIAGLGGTLLGWRYRR